MSSDRCELLCLDLEKAEALRLASLDDSELRQVAEESRALGDPTRLRLALALRDGDELCVCDLAWIVEKAENLVSHHVRQLRSVGLADYRRDGKLALYFLTDRGRMLVADIARRAAVR